MGPENQHRQQKRIRGDLAVSGGDVPAGKGFDDADDQPSGQGAGQAAKAADDGRGKSLDAHQPSCGVNRSLGRKKDTGNSGHHAGQCPDEPLNPFDGYSHVIGRQLVLRCALHSQAKLGAAEENIQSPGQQDRHHDDGNILHPKNQPAKTDFLTGQRALQGLRLVAPDQPGGKTDHEPQGDGQDHDGSLAFTEQAADDQPVNEIAKRPHDPQRHRQRNPEGQAHIFGIRQPDGDKGPQHHEIALGKIHRLCGLVDQNEPQGDQAIDTAIRQPADQQLRIVQTVLPIPVAPVIFPTGLRFARRLGLLWRDNDFAVTLF